MLPIPENVSAQFSQVLTQRAIHKSRHGYYKKWLRYFLDFFNKYQPAECKSEQVHLFIEKKYPAAAKEFIWQWFFPQKELTPIPGTKERRRYHLHESKVQGALKKAARKAKLTKRVKSHTFRHSFATHLCKPIMIFARFRQCSATPM